MARLTYSDYKAFVKHYLGGGDPNTVLATADATKGQIVNDAGRYLFAMHEWSFRSRPESLDLDFVSGQEYIELPPDFDSVVSIEASDSLESVVHQTSLSGISRLRESVVDDVSRYFVSLAYPTQESMLTGAPAARLEIWPTPTTSQQSAMRLVYKAGWTELFDDNAVPNIPVKFEALLRKCCEAFAKDQDNDDMEAIELLERSTYLRRMKQSDGMDQYDIGSPVGGIVTHDSEDMFKPFALPVPNPTS